MVAGILTAAVTAAVLTASGGAPGAGADCVRAEGRFAPSRAHAPALTYDRNLVPPGARILVTQRHEHGGTRVGLRVKGVRAGHEFGVHVHRKPCGVDPEAAGGHYQNHPDPVQPSENPDYVNPGNEVWLDFTARRDGSGAASAVHPWNFRPGEAASVVLHREQGGAGDRVACFTVPFEPRAGK
ncbi:superoxide dismutase [Streptomyces silvensis]|uniref:Superoxide dismutase n=1 Tax=Streptomyces silvensis TaxID=1765722 RepID=A0A0W7XAK9_9ACTN|nr:superoxide dismutase [Streptomyces silvensis]KUF20038.1 superoxide dismutase [Streptomyces silvensis]